MGTARSIRWLISRTSSDRKSAVGFDARSGVPLIFFSGGEQDLAPASVGVGSLGSIVFTEGEEGKILRACQILVDEKIAIPILLTVLFGLVLTPLGLHDTYFTVPPAAARRVRSRIAGGWAAWTATSRPSGW